MELQKVGLAFLTANNHHYPRHLPSRILSIDSELSPREVLELVFELVLVHVGVFEHD